MLTECKKKIGGWDSNTGEVPSDREAEIINVFKNVDLNLRTAGGKGWSQVFKVRLFVTDMNEEFVGLFLKHFKQWVPDHQPILTGVGVAALAAPDMHLEVEVHAHIPEEKKA